MSNEEIASILKNIARLLELKGENPFKTRAYQNAARSIEGLSEPVARLVETDRLGEMDGIGKALQEKITTLVEKGQLDYYDNLRAEFPDDILDLLDLNGLGPKKAKALYESLGVASLADLVSACQSGKVAELDGFGEKTAQKLLAAVEQKRQFAGQFRYAKAMEQADTILDLLRTHPDISQLSLAGSLRRGKEVVKDVDLIASSKNPKQVMKDFVSIEEASDIINHGETKSSIRLKNGLQIDLRVVDDASFASALHHFTGSKEHNVALRQRAKDRNLKISEWGIFDTSGKSEKKLPCRDEAEFFAHLGLDEIPAELRENQGEIAAAEGGTLPDLVQWNHLRGCFHNHTTASDGRHSLREMAEAAAAIGLEYLGIADHSKSSVQANGLSVERLMEQVQAIAELNKEMKDEIRILAGVECDILKDGKLDYPDDVLKQLDYVVASVHSSFTLSEKEQTKRICRAMENPHVTLLGHPTGRLLLEREGYALDIEQILKQAVETDTWIELNASPYRLDLDWRHWKKARDLGVRCVINPDAHSTRQLGHLKPAVQIARKGWLRKKDIINTLPLKKIEILLDLSPVK